MRPTQPTIDNERLTKHRRNWFSCYFSTERLGGCVTSTTMIVFYSLPKCLTRILKRWRTAKTAVFGQNLTCMGLSVLTGT